MKNLKLTREKNNGTNKLYWINVWFNLFIVLEKDAKTKINRSISPFTEKENEVWRAKLFRLTLCMKLKCYKYDRYPNLEKYYF